MCDDGEEDEAGGGREGGGRRRRMMRRRRVLLENKNPTQDVGNKAIQDNPTIKDNPHSTVNVPGILSFKPYVFIVSIMIVQVLFSYRA